MRAVLHVVLILFGTAVPAAESRTFQPAFTPEDIDWSRTRQFIDGKPAEPNVEQVKKALGFHPEKSNWDENKWQIGPIDDGAEHTFRYLIVLKAPVAVGTICSNAGDLGEYEGSRNRGEVSYLRPGAKVPSDPLAASWIKAEPVGPQPYLRFATLPPGTKTQAFLYTDVRARGPARLMYWQFYKPRLASVTPAAAAYAEAPVEANNLVRGGSWQTKRNNRPVNEQNPAQCVLTWNKPQPISGIFLYSNGSQFQLFQYVGDISSDPSLAPPSAWKPIKTTSEADHEHAFQHYAYRFRWLGCPSLKTQAVMLVLRGVERGGSDTWVSGLGVFADLGTAELPKFSTPDEQPPFRFPVQLPVGGELTMNIHSADGKQMRAVAMQAARNQGAADEPWDLKDSRGDYVALGKYKVSGIIGPPIELHYQLTTLPNVQQHFPDRVPWMMGHDSPHGWLSDHGNNWAVAAFGDRVYFGSSIAEAGVAFIECDSAGKKLWGKHDFGPWQGVSMMAADDEAVYVDRGGTVFRFDPKTQEAKELFQYGQNPARRGFASAFAAHGGKVAICYTAEPFIDHATKSSELDLENCLPKLPDGGNFARLLRMESTPPGNNVEPHSDKPIGNGQLDLESTVGSEQVQYNVIAFKSPVPIGSVTFPSPQRGEQVELSVLKAGAPYPPRHTEEGDWLPFAVPVRTGWNCMPAPPATSTRALRIKFTRPKGKEGQWFGRIEGLRLIRRRFDSPLATAKIRVSSGKVAKDGSWNAERKTAVWHDDPGVYLMEWTMPQKLSGIAFQEVDGAVVEIDVWQGTAPKKFSLTAKAQDQHGKKTGWRNVARHTQARRSAQYNHENNRFARYLDGYVDFNATIETPAVRLRVTEQWLDNGGDGAACREHDGRSEHGLHYSQSYAHALDTRLCSIEGVAPLRYLGQELPLDPLAYERVEIYDGKTGKLLKELATRLGWHGLSFGKNGDLFGIAKDHKSIVRVDQQTGKTSEIVKCGPHTMTVGPDDLIYVHSFEDNNTRPIEVYNLRGELVRTIGHEGGWRPGPWDPERIGPVHRMCVDKHRNLWLVESDYYPRRIVQYKTDGTFVKEILGNTYYGNGGGGTLNRFNKKRAYYGRVEFQIDWEKHTSQIRGLLADGLHNNDIVAASVKGQKVPYLVTAPLSMDARQPVGCVHIYDNKTGTVRLVAAMGEAASFGPLRTSPIISKLNGEVLRDFTFLWSDLKGNGAPEADEVAFEKKSGAGGVGRFDSQLGCTGNGVYYLPAKFLADGTPVYERRQIPGAPHLRLNNGNFLTLHSSPKEGEPSENFVTNSAGKKLWGYPAHGGVSGLGIPGWSPGIAATQFSIIGHETADEAGLGEFVVVHSNTGQWTIWTSDGLLAGEVLMHKGDGRAKFLGPDKAPPGTRLDPLTANQEHFHGFFTKSVADGKYYINMGFTNMSLIEVVGIDRFRRVSGEFEVTASDIEKAKTWEATRATKQVAARALVVAAGQPTSPPTIDGRISENEWPTPPAVFEDNSAEFRIAQSGERLFVSWTGRGLGPLKNGGNEYQRYFKTGACLDLMLAADPNADPKRNQPARGDQRLLIALVDGKPRAVLYQPVNPSAEAKERWESATPAGGKTSFDRVKLLETATVAIQGENDFTVEASIPLAELELTPQSGSLYKLDWGILTTGDGNQVKQRRYWANSFATGTADEAIESRLEPHLWGHVRFE